ncbi:MAG: hypothetical protein QOJ95_2119 [Mycobacterium sp.]|nr:hypothetical protein [Mycobacterium sp.]
MPRSEAALTWPTHPQHARVNTQPRGLRLLCPQGCGATLTVTMPTLAEVHEPSGDSSLESLDTLVGRSVVGAVLMHCLYSCNAISDVHPMLHVAGNPVPDSQTTTPTPTHPEWSTTNRRRK